MRNSELNTGLLDVAWPLSVCDLFTYLDLDIGTIWVHSFCHLDKCVRGVRMGRVRESECL